ncbi:MAG TPA: protein kinase [Gemmatimonadaceae bacterium]|nr:protein kinase [Gemmatimonadaceae bacterium]
MLEAPPRLSEALATRYRIERELGAGGMATVYLAHDLRHDRKVAVKVLRPELAAVIGADRFLAEIHTTAALQHPHILPLYDSGQADGFLFYVMPFIEGESLRVRLTREHQLPVDEAVRIAKEIGSALDYAHRHGVIHRDIKPENVLLHDGAALVADFGIALAVSHAGGNRMTETGLSLGTPGYMSPEQATGERGLDARSDVYSLGCLLYEMLAGEPPHTGPTVQAVIAAVVTKDPERLSVRRRTVPANVEAAVHRALAKLPADRFASADAFVHALGDTTFAVPSLSLPTGAAPAAASKANRYVAALGTAAVVVGALALWGWMRPRPAPTLERYSLHLRPSEAVMPTTTALSGGHLAISPDGRKLIYVGHGEGTSRLWIKDRDQVHPTPISGTDGALSPFFSPDGKQVGFVKDGKTVRLMPLDGGAPLTLTDSANATAADWGTDGYVYFEVDSGIARMRATGGKIEPVYKVKQHELGTEWPNVLPSGRGVIFRLRHESQAAADFEIAVVKLPGGDAQVITRGVYARYSPSGHLLVVTHDGKLLAMPFDEKALKATGPPVALYEGLDAAPFAGQIAISPTGMLVYETASNASQREAIWVTRAGEATPVDPQWKPDGTINTIALSPDGKQIALELVKTKSDIWVKQLPAGPFSRITFGDTANMRPSWSPDGRNVVYLADRGDGAGLPFMRRADGVGAPQRLLVKRMGFGQVAETPDGQWLVLRRAVSDEGNGDIYAMKMGDTTLVPLVTTPAREFTPAVSPDGKWLAYASNESGVSEIYVRPFPNAASARWQVSATGGSEPVWAHSGKELFYRNGHNDLVAAQINSSAGFSVGAQTTLFSLSPFLPTGSVQLYSVAPDDKRFLMLRETVSADPKEVIVTENWFSELNARVHK